LRASPRERRQAGAAGLVVDLSGVTFIDADGRALLEEMCRGGVDLHACGCMTRAVRDEIVAAARTRRPA